MATMRLKFTVKERDIIRGMMCDDSGVSRALERAREKNGRWEVLCTLDSLEHLINSLAAEANHVEDSKKQKRLDALCDRLQGIQEKDGSGGSAENPLGLADQEM